MNRKDYDENDTDAIHHFLEQILDLKEKQLAEIQSRITSSDFSQRIVNESMEINTKTSIERLKKSIIHLSYGRYGLCKTCGNKISYYEIISYPCKTRCGNCIKKK